jgi:two-component system, NarL family, sensor kinase
MADQVGESRDPSPLLAGERQVLEMIATGAALPSVLDELCRIIDRQSGLMSGVVLLSDDGRLLRFVSGPNLPDTWRKALSAAPLPVTAAGPCGAAVTRREPVVVSDASVDPSYGRLREDARVAGIRYAWSTPFYSKDRRVLGTFAVFGRVAESPSDRHVALVDRATHLASIAVERHQTDEDLRESEIRFSTVFYANSACMVITRFSDGRFLYVNDRFVSMFGYSRQEAVGRTALELGLYLDPQRRPAIMELLGGRMAHDVEAKARTKSGVVIDVLVWAERVQILGDDCVLFIACDVTDRKRAEEELRRSEGLLRLVLDALPVGVAVVDRSGDVILTNPASKRIWGNLIQSGRQRYARSRGWWHDTGARIAPDEWASARALSAGESSLNEVIDIETFDGVRKVIQNSAIPIRDTSESVTGAVIVNEDISARETAERKLNDSYQQMRTLTGRLMRAQDDERRRIAQLLHETTAQNLAALKMLLARVSRTADAATDEGRRTVAESIALADQSMTEIRTLSYLLHPPFLDEAGLLSALRWYGAGFAERSGIEVDLDLPDSFERLPLDTETALFRVVQESLINIHRHAGSQTALIRLRREAQTLELEIADRGRGISKASLDDLMKGEGGVGVGIAGMSERIEQLGGRLEIASGAQGTTVIVRLPLLEAGA